jgi:sigma-B regulation protein RsbU (phosphoserine phosphatase)
MSNDSENNGNKANVEVSKHTATVLLVDDQPIVAEAVRRMLADESDIVFHYCQDPTKAIEEANRLSPTVILQDLVMPELDGLTLVKFFRVNPKTREIPLIVLSTKEEPTIKAQAFATGANDYLVKLPDKLEMIARIRYHSKGYIAQLERNEAYRRLAESQKQLADEVAQAAKYVCSLLPEPIGQGPVRVDWRFVPSMQLGGDSFGFHWLDDDHFAMYLLDVSGHGVGASLLSVSAMNVLRSQTLPSTDFRNPGQVLQGLNATFDMDLHDNKYFTIWYGVFRRSTRQLFYGGGGHPPALLCEVCEDGKCSLKPLDSTGPIIGMMPDMPFDTECIVLEPEAKLYLFSDGVFEIDQPDGRMWKFDDFLAFVSQGTTHGSIMDRLLENAQKLHGSDRLSDDFSMVEIAF